MGIEPTSSAWKAEVLPLNYTRSRQSRQLQTFCHRKSRQCPKHGEGGRITPRLRRSTLRAVAATRQRCGSLSQAARTSIGSNPPPAGTQSTTGQPRSRLLNQIVVEGGGFEPPKAEPADLQSAPFGRSGTPPKNKPAIVANRPGVVNTRAHATRVF